MIDRLRKMLLAVLALAAAGCAAGSSGDTPDYFSGVFIPPAPIVVTPGYLAPAPRPAALPNVYRGR